MLTGQDYLRIGQGLLEEGNATEALHYLRQAEQELPDRYEVVLALGQALVLEGETAAAEGCFRRCVAMAEDRHEAYEAWADLSAGQGLKEQQRRLAALARARGGGSRVEPIGPAAWDPGASAPKEGDLWFFCPKCDAPIRRGLGQLSCPGCGSNLVPILHGHVEPRWALDGTQEFFCESCSAKLSGTELTCPDCSTNLLTGEKPAVDSVAPHAPVSVQRVASRRSLIAVVVGFLLLTIGIGQWREPNTRRDMARAWHTVSTRWNAARETVPEEVDRQTHKPMDISVEADNNLLITFAKYFGLVLVGGLILLLGLLKMAFDR